MLINRRQMECFSIKKLKNSRKSQKNTICSQSDKWLDELTSLIQKHLKMIE